MSCTSPTVSKLQHTHTCTVHPPLSQNHNTHIHELYCVQPSLSETTKHMHTYMSCIPHCLKMTQFDKYNCQLHGPHCGKTRKTPDIISEVCHCSAVSCCQHLTNSLHLLATPPLVLTHSAACQTPAWGRETTPPVSAARRNTATTTVCF